MWNYGSGSMSLLKHALKRKVVTEVGRVKYQTSVMFGLAKEQDIERQRCGETTNFHSNYNCTELWFYGSALLIQRSPSALQILSN